MPTAQVLDSHTYPHFAFETPPELSGTEAGRHEVVIVGGGPVGLAAALDLARRGRRSVILNSADTVSVGSRAICWAKRSIEICDRLGFGDRIVEKGITWKDGRVFVGDENIYKFDLLPEQGHRFPAFVNLQQYYFEEFAVARVQNEPLIDLRWQSRVTGVAQDGGAVTLTVETPDGAYTLTADYVLAADGVRSAVRRALDLEFSGKVFEDRFLIADVKMKADFPTERWFWFDPPFNPGQSALLHRQADDVWRIDLQLGWDADPDEERKPENVIPRIRRMLGPDADFDLEWVSVYTFQCRRLEKFRHGRILFIGDSAHQVSPFGARGGNGGLQDADNLIWKLDLVMRGSAPESLLDSYDDERIFAGDENIANSTRSTDFITPKSPASKMLRDSVLALAKQYPFARRLVNSGRLSLPAVLSNSPLNTPDSAAFLGPMRPGAPCLDAPVTVADGSAGWLLRQLGDGFTLLGFGAAASALTEDGFAEAMRAGPVPVAILAVSDDSVALGDPDGLASERYDARDGALYLIRPDQHVAARWRTVDPAAILTALRRACGLADT